MTTAEIVRDLCKKNRVSITELEKTLGFGNGSLNKSSDYSSSRLVLIAKYFNVSMEYLVGLPDPSGYRLDSDETALINSFRNLSDAGKQYIMQTIAMASSVYGIEVKGDSLTDTAI